MKSISDISRMTGKSYNCVKRRIDRMGKKPDGYRTMMTGKSMHRVNQYSDDFADSLVSQMGKVSKYSPYKDFDIPSTKINKRSAYYVKGIVDNSKLRGLIGKKVTYASRLGGVRTGILEEVGSLTVVIDGIGMLILNAGVQPYDIR